MYEKVRKRVISAANHHHNLATYFFSQAGIDPDKSDQNDDQNNEKVRASSKGTRVMIDQRVDEHENETDVQARPPKSQEHIIAEMHLEASKQLKALAESAPPSTAAIKQIRDGLPDYLKRGSVPPSKSIIR